MKSRAKNNELKMKLLNFHAVFTKLFFNNKKVHLKKNIKQSSKTYTKKQLDYDKSWLNSRKRIWANAE